MIVVVMGVAGSGKTTVGQRLAGALGCSFYDADAFHPPANVDKMNRGDPLTDDDRWPWLDALRGLIDDLARRGESAVLACSALKRAYRDRLMEGHDAIRLVYLKGDFDIIQRRLAERGGHFFGPALLRSQFDTLEEPANAIIVDVAPSPEIIVQEIRHALNV